MESVAQSHFLRLCGIFPADRALLHTTEQSGCAVERTPHPAVGNPASVVSILIGCHDRVQPKLAGKKTSQRAVF